MSSTDNRSLELIAVTSTFLCITILSVGLRAFTRLHLVKWIGVDDALIICAAVAAIAESSATIIATEYGLGRHIDEQLPEWREPYAKAILTTNFTYTISATFVKLSLLAFYIRLSLDTTLRFAIYVVIFVSASFGISSLLAAGLQCIPLSMLWDSNQPGHCININSFYFSNAGIHILTELLIYILPMRTLWKLHMPLKQKLGLCGLMGLGAMLIIISCYRIITIRDLLVSDDLTWNTVTPLMWDTIELNLAIFIACTPAFLAFFRHYLPSIFGGSSTQSNYQASPHRSSYPLGSITRSITHTNKSGQKMIVTARDRPYFGSDNNNSKEIIIISDSRIQK